MIKFYSFPFLFVLYFPIHSIAQSCYWQQYVHYQMDINMDVKSNRFDGKQTLTLVNNSPDTLNELFYHLYFNAFQPGSSMDEHSRNIADPDRRVGDRISKLNKSEIGFQHINHISIKAQKQTFEISETILKVFLSDYILPGDTCYIEMEFSAQVPIQIRRSGRDNAEGIDYSMSQWYPKLCVYDEEGWHPEPYISREFYGNFGEFDVNITIDKAYVVAGTGIPENYEGELLKNTKSKIWKFKASKVHDFMWAADRDYTHKVFKLQHGPVLHLYYQPDEKYNAAWEKLPTYVDKMFQKADSLYGKYPYPVFYVIQGGDGGMEYPMGTLVLGNRTLGSLIGTVGHEMMHSWFQGVLGFNEMYYPWMDEGFTTYADKALYEFVVNQGKNKDPYLNIYNKYFLNVQKGSEEPLITQADQYRTNASYGDAVYDKGSMYLNQLNYIMGNQNFHKGMLSFYRDWSFKHPNPKNFLRSMEKASGLVLDWYEQYWINSVYTIDYGISDVKRLKSDYQVDLIRIGYMPMPIDILATFEDNTQVMYNIPTALMRGSKLAENPLIPYFVTIPWQWPVMNYQFKITSSKKLIKLEIDPSHRMADTNKENNTFELH